MDSATRGINTPSEKRLDRAVQYVSDLWFPANPALVAKLQTSLSISPEESDLDEILNELRTDFSLYSYCLKELMALLRNEGVEPPPFMNPLNFMRWAGADRLKTILDIKEQTISTHYFTDMSAAQVERMKEAVISASTAQVLAQHSQIDPELGYSAALLRQLGFTLIAWNYPSVYDRAKNAVREGVSLDVAITQILGFSPTALSVRLLQSWGLTESLCQVIVDTIDCPDEQERTALEVDAVSHSVAQLCRVGEALARANNPGLYPTAREDWDFAKSQILKTVGPKGLQIIQEAVIVNSENYIAAVPHFFTGGTILDPERALASQERESIFTRNPHLAQCSDLVKGKLCQLYEKILQGRPSHENTRLLVKEIIPSSGFSSGCVYTIEPSSNMLVPQLFLGDMRLRSIQPVTYQLDSPGHDPVCLAFQGREPVVEKNSGTGEMIFAGLAGVIGHSNRIGVLYLEIPQIVFKESEKLHLTHFKAFCGALTDCLTIEAAPLSQEDSYGAAPQK